MEASVATPKQLRWLIEYREKKSTMGLDYPAVSGKSKIWVKPNGEISIKGFSYTSSGWGTFKFNTELDLKIED